MPELDWNETDFLECLGVIPQLDEFETKHFYEVEEHGLRLTVAVWPLESLVMLSLLQGEADTPITSFALVVRGCIQYIKDKRGEYLEFNDCIVVSNRFYYLETGDVFDKTKFTHGLKIELSVKPRLSIKFQ